MSAARVPCNGVGRGHALPPGFRLVSRRGVAHEDHGQSFLVARRARPRGGSRVQGDADAGGDPQGSGRRVSPEQRLREGRRGVRQVDRGRSEAGKALREQGLLPHECGGHGRRGGDHLEDARLQGRRGGEGGRLLQPRRHLHVQANDGQGREELPEGGRAEPERRSIARVARRDLVAARRGARHEGPCQARGARQGDRVLRQGHRRQTRDPGLVRQQAHRHRQARGVRAPGQRGRREGGGGRGQGQGEGRQGDGRGREAQGQNGGLEAEARRSSARRSARS